MSFSEYVDSLSKRGIIDGNIAEMLVGKHKAECANPAKLIQDKVNPILDEMFVFAKATGIQRVCGFAARIDDAING